MLRAIFEWGGPRANSGVFWGHANPPSAVGSGWEDAMLNEQRRGVTDHESDPAHNTEEGHEWVDEGGASHLGPATHTESGHPQGEESEPESE